MKIFPRNIPQHRYMTAGPRGAFAVALALPRMRYAFPWPSAAQRRWCAMTFGVMGLAAAIVYILAVNIIVAHGEAIRQSEALIKKLERENSLVADAAYRQQSPAWLETRSRANGMVSVEAVSHVVEDQSVVFSPRY